MASKRFTDEFKAEAVKQVSERGYPVTEVAERLGVSSHSLYGWLRERAGSVAKCARPRRAWTLSRRTPGCVRSCVAPKRSATF